MRVVLTVMMVTTAMVRSDDSSAKLECLKLVEALRKSGAEEANHLDCLTRLNYWKTREDPAGAASLKIDNNDGTFRFFTVRKKKRKKKEIHQNYEKSTELSEAEARPRPKPRKVKYVAKPKAKGFGLGLIITLILVYIGSVICSVYLTYCLFHRPKGFKLSSPVGSAKKVERCMCCSNGAIIYPEDKHPIVGTEANKKNPTNKKPKKNRKPKFTESEIVEIKHALANFLLRDNNFNNANAQSKKDKKGKK